MRAKLTSFSAIFALARCLPAWGVEPSVESIEKMYRSGESVSMTCNALERGVCDLKVRMGATEWSYSLNFGEQGERPNLSEIKLVSPTESPFSAAVVVAVECAGRASERVSDHATDAVCLKYIYVNDTPHVTWGATYVRGQLEKVPIPGTFEP